MVWRWGRSASARYSRSRSPHRCTGECPTTCCWRCRRRYSARRRWRWSSCRSRRRYPSWRCPGRPWSITLTTLNAAAQLSLPQWVRARGLAIYLLVATGSQAIGSYFWGAVATGAGLDTAMLDSAVALGAVALSVAVLPLRPGTGRLSVDISTAWPSPVSVFEPSPNDGPVLVTVWYRVAEENRADFIDAMSAVRRSRLRTGGHSWRLYHSVGQPDMLLERFTVPSWTEFERQRTERWVEYDHEGVQKAISYTVDGTRRHEY